jgi:hypothetical protein
MTERERVMALKKCHAVSRGCSGCSDVSTTAVRFEGSEGERPREAKSKRARVLVLS